MVTVSLFKAEAFNFARFVALASENPRFDKGSAFSAITILKKVKKAMKKYSDKGYIQENIDILLGKFYPEQLKKKPK